MTDSFRLIHQNTPFDGLFVLDGDVLESFGFGHPESVRVNVKLATPVELIDMGGQMSIRLGSATPGTHPYTQMVDPADPEVNRLVDAIRAAQTK